MREYQYPVGIVGGGAWGTALAAVMLLTRRVDWYRLAPPAAQEHVKS